MTEVLQFYEIIMVLISFVIVFLSFSLPSYAASFDPEINWRTIDSEHFSLHYPDSLDSITGLTLQYLEEVHATLSPKLKWEPWGKTQVLSNG